ncbi:type IV pilin [Methanorbis rubei]
MKSVAKKNDAVSPVIGTILLVAITVVLVAIVAAVVMGMVGGVGQSKTVGVTVTPSSVNTSHTGFILTVTGGPDAGSLSNVTAYMEGVTFAESGVVKNMSVGVPTFVQATAGAPKSGTLTLTGTFNDGSKYVIYQNQFSIPATTTT